MSENEKKIPEEEKEPKEPDEEPPKEEKLPEEEKKPKTPEEKPPKEEKQSKNPKQINIYEYDQEKWTIKLKNKKCPRCGKIMAFHKSPKQRWTCGSCSYTEFVKKDMNKLSL